MSTLDLFVGFLTWWVFSLKGFSVSILVHEDVFLKCLSSCNKYNDMIQWCSWAFWPSLLGSWLGELGQPQGISILQDFFLKCLQLFLQQRNESIQWYMSFMDLSVGFWTWWVRSATRNSLRAASCSRMFSLNAFNSSCSTNRIWYKDVHELSGLVCWVLDPMS